MASPARGDGQSQAIKKAIANLAIAFFVSQSYNESHRLT